MLDSAERRSVLRALTKGYLAYRDLSYRAVCKSANILVVKQFDTPNGGSYDEFKPCPYNPEFDIELRHLREKKQWKKAERHEKRHRFASRFAHRIEIPGVYYHPVIKEDVFWHEIGHMLISDFFPGYVGFAAIEYEFTNDHWEHERLVDAFSAAMMLYRNDLEPKLGSEKGCFFFADETSLNYPQMARFNAARIARYCEEARGLGRNINLARLDQLVACLSKLGDGLGTQPDLPMYCPHTTTELEHGYVDWFEDWERNQQRADKESWREPSQEEQRLVQEARALRHDLKHWQFALFTEDEQLNHSKFQKRPKRFEAAVKRYTEN